MAQFFKLKIVSGIYAAYRVQDPMIKVEDSKGNDKLAL